ncbi:MAG: LSM domain-containing protein [Candidatus Hodarchaeota archaeon]
MRPLDLLSLNLNREIVVQIKRNQRFTGKLAGFDEHLNIYVEDVKSEYYIEEEKEVPEENFDADDDDEIKLPAAVVKKAGSGDVENKEYALKKYQETVGSIILRGDNIIFMKFNKPNFSRPQKPPYHKKKHYQGSYQQKDYRRDRSDSRRRSSEGYNRSSRDNRDSSRGYDNRDRYKRSDNDNRKKPYKPRQN